MFPHGSGALRFLCFSLGPPRGVPPPRRSFRPRRAEESKPSSRCRCWCGQPPLHLPAGFVSTLPDQSLHEIGPLSASTATGLMFDENTRTQLRCADARGVAPPDSGSRTPAGSARVGDMVPAWQFAVRGLRIDCRQLLGSSAPRDARPLVTSCTSLRGREGNRAPDYGRRCPVPQRLLRQVLQALPQAASSSLATRWKASRWPCRPRPWLHGVPGHPQGMSPRHRQPDMGRIPDRSARRRTSPPEALQ